MCRCEAKTSGTRRPRRSEEATVEACLTLGPDHRSSCMMTMMSRCIKRHRSCWQTSSALPGSVCCSKTQQSGADLRAPCTMPWHLCKKAVCRGTSKNDSLCWSFRPGGLPCHGCTSQAHHQCYNAGHHIYSQPSRPGPGFTADVRSGNAASNNTQKSDLQYIYTHIHVMPVAVSLYI